MSDSSRIFGRQMAQQSLTEAQINEVSGGTWPWPSGSPDSMCYVDTQDSVQEFEPDDCTVDRDS